MRGAPLIGVAAAYGLAMEVARTPTAEALERGAAVLAGARPTARNLGWAVERVVAAAAAASDLAAAAREAAEAIQREDEAASAALARHGADALEAALPAGPLTVMTHCNSGALAASGRGTGLGVIAELADRRERARAGVRGAAAAAGRAADGLGAAAARDRARAAGRRRRPRAAAHRRRARRRHRLRPRGGERRRGEQGRHLRARAGRDAAGVPFLAAGPSSSIDLRLASGDAIEIEERDADEVRAAGGALLTVEGTACRNPAFDVTPAELVWALVTERGAASPVTAETVARVA